MTYLADEAVADLQVDGDRGESVECATAKEGGQRGGSKEFQQSVPGGGVSRGNGKRERVVVGSRAESKGVVFDRARDGSCIGDTRGADDD